MSSLERQVVVGQGLVLLLAFGLLFWISVTAISAISEAHILASLAHDAETLVGAYGFNRRGELRLREHRVPPVYQQFQSGHYFVFTFADGQVIRSDSLVGEGLMVPESMASALIVRRQFGPNNQWLLVRSAAYEKAGRAFVLTVAENLSPTLALIRTFQGYALGVFVLATVIILITQAWILRRGFRRLDQVRYELQRINAGQQRQLETLGPTEIQPLTREINHLTNQLQSRLKRSRQALGNLAHALKSPLSLLMRDLDAAPVPDGDKGRLHQGLDRIHSLVERELKRARLAGETVGERFHPSRHLPELIEALQRMHGTELIFVAEKLPQAPIPFDVEDMLELLGNLMDNACQWARSQVVVEMDLNGALKIRVADDGPGIPQDEADALLLRGVRQDEQVAGYGLGLSIVSDLVQVYQGRIQLSRSEALGGLEVRVQLPLSVDMSRSHDQFSA